MAKKVLHSQFCDMVGIRYPIIQAGMGPFSTNRLAAAAANAGVLGIISTSGFGMLGRPPSMRSAGRHRWPGHSAMTKVAPGKSS